MFFQRTQQSDLPAYFETNPFKMLNVKQGSCEYLLLKSFGLTWPENRILVYRLRGELRGEASISDCEASTDCDWIPSLGLALAYWVNFINNLVKYLACLHDQNKSGFFGGLAFIQSIRAIWKVFKKLWFGWKKPALQKSHFCFDHVNRLRVNQLKQYV